MVTGHRYTATSARLDLKYKNAKIYSNKLNYKIFYQRIIIVIAYTGFFISEDNYIEI